jgi:hypothetical protein
MADVLEAVRWNILLQYIYPNFQAISMIKNQIVLLYGAVTFGQME